MRSYIGRHINRETEQILLDIIGDYASGSIGRGIYGYLYRMRFFVTKRRHLGKIYVERGRNICVDLVDGRVAPKFYLPRKYLTSFSWEADYGAQLRMLQRKLVNIKTQLLCLDFEVAPLRKQMEIIENGPNDFWLMEKW
jgi:hypothetical protein